MNVSRLQNFKQMNQKITNMKTGTNQIVKIFLFLFLPTSMVMAQAPDILWTKSIGESESQVAYAVFPTGDGGFMLGGYITSTGYRDFYMVKTDGEGEVIWTKSFGEDARYEAAKWMIETVDGGYILAGGRGQDPPYSSNTDIYLVKTDANGEVQWSSIIGFEDISESANSIVQTSDGGYIVCGSYWATAQTGYDVLLIKTTDLGVQEWRQVLNFEDGKAERAYGIIQADDGGYLVTGKTQAFSINYDYNAFILKTNIVGEMEWLKTYGEEWPWYELTFHIIHTSDGGFFLCGNQDNDGIDRNWFVVKTDGNGDQLWSNNTIGGTYHDGAYYACETTGGGIAVTGSYHQDVWNAFIAKYNIDGDTLWTKMWGTGDNNSQYNYAIQQLDDGGYITAGSTTTSSGGPNIYLTRLSPGTTGIHNSDYDVSGNQIEFIENKPNPFSSKTTITYKLKSNRQINISVYNIYGQKIEELVSVIQPPGLYEVEFDCKDRQGGVYFCVLSSGDEIVTRKLIQKKQ